MTSIRLLVAVCILCIFQTKSANGCKDNHIWIVDGSVDCIYLKTESMYGIHHRQRHYCLEYPQTDCCETCTQLGHVKSAKKASGSSNVPGEPIVPGEPSVPGVSSAAATGPAVQVAPAGPSNTVTVELTPQQLRMYEIMMKMLGTMSGQGKVDTITIPIATTQ